MRIAWVATLVFALSAPSVAHAAFPGQNGRIAFTNGPDLQSTAVDIYSAEPDGNAVARLTTDGISLNPAFSPDGSQLAYTSGSKVYIAGQYANDPQLVLDIGVGAYGLDWAPDGTRLVASFPNCDEFDCNPDIYVFGADGSGLTNLTNTPWPEYKPAWAPDDSKIAFTGVPFGGQSDIYTINPDGTGLDNITDDPDLGADASRPDWSPDASRIAFQFAAGTGVLAWSVNPDGSDPVLIPGVKEQPTWSPDGDRFVHFDPGTRLALLEVTGSFDAPHGPLGPSPFGRGREPDWQVRQPDPVPPPSGVGFPRPKGATPLIASLVPAYNGCSSGNVTRQHGPPLAYPSCHPSPGASGLTVGTPDSNGLPAEAAGLVRIDAVPGDPATPADEADVWIGVNQTDVRYNVSQSGYPDYTGKLMLVLPLRTSDLYNAGGDPDGSGTLVDFSLYVEIPCTPTAGAAGSTCAVNTTVDAVVPGFVRERKRALWEIGQAKLQYEGPDGEIDTLADNRTFLASGLFVP